MTVTKSDLVNRMAEATGWTKVDCEILLNGFLANIIESLQEVIKKHEEACFSLSRSLCLQGCKYPRRSWCLIADCCWESSHPRIR